MKSLIGLLLTLSIALPACSAENGSSATTEPLVANTDTTQSTTTPPPPVVNSDVTPTTTAGTRPAATEKPPVVAQLQDAKPTTAPPTRSDIVAGRHYRILTPAQPTSSSPDKIEVAEIFMYSCPHCMDFEPFIKSYLQSKPGYVDFVRIPASFNSTARLHAKAFYMADTLGILDDVHMDFFNEYHTARNRLASEKSIIDFFVKRGAALDDVTGAYNSFVVDSRTRKADDLNRRYGIDAVPAVVINGKYVTSGSMTGSISKLREVIDYLTAKEAAQL